MSAANRRSARNWWILGLSMALSAGLLSASLSQPALGGSGASELASDTGAPMRPEFADIIEDLMISPPKARGVKTAN